MPESRRKIVSEGGPLLRTKMRHCSSSDRARQKGKKKDEAIIRIRPRAARKAKSEDLVQFARTAIQELRQSDSGQEGECRQPAAGIDEKTGIPAGQCGFRMGFAGSRITARQLVSHNNFLVNGKPVNLPSRQIKTGDTVSVAPRKLKNAYFTKQQGIMKNYKAPAWLAVNAEKMEGKKTGDVTMEELQPVAEIGSVFEFYAR